METNLVAALLALWAMIPVVYVQAFVVFILIGLLKGSGVLGEDVWAKLANILGSYLISGAKVPESGEDAASIFMTMLVASLYYQAWKLIKPFVEKVWNRVGGMIGFEKEAEKATG